MIGADHGEHYPRVLDALEPGVSVPPDPKILYWASLVALLLGVGLLWPAPVAGALLMVGAGFGLVISLETEFDGAPVPPRIVTLPIVDGVDGPLHVTCPLHLGVDPPSWG